MSSIEDDVTADFTIHGTEGTIYLDASFRPRNIVLRNKAEEEIETFSMALENGFEYEMEAVAECIRSGKLEHPSVPHKLTCDFAKVIDMIFAQDPSASL